MCIVFAPEFLETENITCKAFPANYMSTTLTNHIGALVPLFITDW